MIEHRIEIEQASAHRFSVTLTVPEPAADQGLSLPVWIPGSYLVREFARHVLSIAARQGRSARAVEATDKATWRVRCEGRAALVVRLVVYARDPSVRAAFLDASRGFFNGTSLCLQVHGRTDEPQRLVIGRLPRGWQVATSMQPQAVDANGVGAYRADDYDDLVDHPFELGPFWSGEFRAGGVTHRLVVSGAWPDFDGDRLLADTRRICEAAIDFWHPPAPKAPGSPRRGSRRSKPPFDRYCFLLHAVDDGYGGLEHRASTALLASRRDLPRQGAAPTDRSDGEVTLLGLISHEYFHSWNVKRLKPREHARIDYSRENLTRLLWFFEGFTSYYDDLLLLRSGLVDGPRYLKLVSRTVTGVLATPGRHLQSLAQASFDAWIKYYRPDENSPNATVSYYTKGGLVALVLDLALREAGGSLDGAMRRLWVAHDGGPVDEADIRQALADELASARGAATAGGLAEDGHASGHGAAVRRGARQQVDRWVDDWVHGTDDLPLRERLAAFGVGWSDAAPTVAQRLGVRAADSSAGVKLSHVLEGGVAREAGLTAGDEILGVNGWRLLRLEDLPRLAGDGSVQLVVSRDHRLIDVRLPARGLASAGAGASHPAALGATVHLTPLPAGAAPAEAQWQDRRRLWLGA